MNKPIVEEAKSTLPDLVENSVLDSGGGMYVSVYKVKDSGICFYFSEIEQSRRSIECVMEIEIDRLDGAPVPKFTSRIDLRSASAIRSLVTDLNNAYGGKKDNPAFNWSIILNTVIGNLATYLKKSITANSLEGEVFTEPSFLLSPFLQEDATNMIFAASEVGKTFFLQRMALSLSSGQDFLGFPSPQGKRTMYIDYEDSKNAFVSRLYKLCAGAGLSYEEHARNIFYYKPHGAIKDEKEIIQRLITENNIALTVIDAGGDAAGGSPSDEEKVLELFNALENITGTKVIVHHEPKIVMSNDNAYYGSTYWKGRSRVAWRLEMESEDMTYKMIKATIQKRSNLPMQPAIFYKQAFVNGEQPSITLMVESKQEHNPHKPIDIQIVAAVTEGGKTTQEIADIIKRTRSVALDWLNKLLQDGKIGKQRSGRSDIWVSKNALLATENEVDF